jgi:hypothetical protein
MMLPSSWARRNDYRNDHSANGHNHRRRKLLPRKSKTGYGQILTILICLTLLETTYLFVLALLDDDNQISWNPTWEELIQLREIDQAWMDLFHQNATAEGEEDQHTDDADFGHEFKTVAALDDYYNRSHIRKPVPLIVGGSDGSGTRAFVQVLLELGVNMVVEDKVTLDVHGSLMFGGEGWPGAVIPVLNATHAATYDIRQLPESTRALVQKELSKLIEVESNRKRDSTSAVSYGFKAPVSMLLLPFFQQELPEFKFLHIVRDGRDVALSENQSPVKKFYHTYYTNAKEREEQLLSQDFGETAQTRIKAIELWNDWNSQVYDYGKEHADGKTLDVLVMRTEDLLMDRYHSLLKLADFVGSPKTPEELCCMAKRQAKDMGTSVGHTRMGREQRDPKSFALLKAKFNNLIPAHARSNWELRNPGKPWVHMKDQLLQERVGEERDTIFKQGRHSMMVARRMHKSRRLTEVRSARLEEENNDDTPEYQSRLKLQGGDNFPPAIRSMPKLHGRAGIDAQLDSIRQNVQDLRLRRNGVGNKHGNVKERYGKWVKALESEPELVLRLHQDGATGLRQFGYEPETRFMDITRPPIMCDSTIVCETPPVTKKEGQKRHSRKESQKRRAKKEGHKRHVRPY